MKKVTKKDETRALNLCWDGPNLPTRHFCSKNRPLSLRSGVFSDCLPCDESACPCSNYPHASLIQEITFFCLGIAFLSFRLFSFVCMLISHQVAVVMRNGGQVNEGSKSFNSASFVHSKLLIKGAPSSP